ncbi:MAG: VCBS repeat-containing protein, partial [Candidatus Cloacimonadaceae bacterium]|nr:VCBS repeat-containing protein [Candidatus Cloacimonadaceae bacterium]
MRIPQCLIALLFVYLLQPVLVAQFTDLLPFQMSDYYSLAWGDYDNDGLPDLAIVCSRECETYTAIFRNNGDGTFVDTGVKLPYLIKGNIAWVDFDCDGDLDLQLSGSADTI